MLLLKKVPFLLPVFLMFFAGSICAQNIDIELLKAINPQNPHSKFWQKTSNSYMVVSGTAIVGSLAAGIIRHDPEMQRHAYEALGAVGIDVILTYGLKKVFDRDRPYEKYPNDVFVLKYADGKSFPSGHSSLAFATATSFTLAYKKWWITVPAYIWAGCVAYSRMYLGQHYPTDVLGGAIVGAGSSLLSNWLSKKIFKQDNKIVQR